MKMFCYYMYANNYKNHIIKRLTYFYNAKYKNTIWDITKTVKNWSKELFR